MRIINEQFYEYELSNEEYISSLKSTLLEIS